MVDAFKLWRYDKETFPNIDPFKLDSINNIAGMESNFRYETIDNNLILIKPDYRTKFDFQGLAGGFILNEVQMILNSFNLVNYSINFDGEFISHFNGGRPQFNSFNNIESLVAKCSNIGILELFNTLNNSKCISFSQNHKIYKTNGNTEISYTINPEMIQPNTHNLVAVIVSSDDCITSDGMATAFIVKGLNDSKEFLNTQSNLKLSCIFITADESGKCYIE